MSDRKDEQNLNGKEGFRKGFIIVKRNAVKSISDGAGSLWQHNGMALVVTWERRAQHTGGNAEGGRSWNSSLVFAFLIVDHLYAGMQKTSIFVRFSF